METIKLEDKLFHAIKPNISSFGSDSDEMAVDITKGKFRGIFKDGLIMCRQDLLSKPGYHRFSMRDFNENYRVSLSRHISVLEYDRTYPGYIVNAEDENAWYDYPFNYPAFVFDQSLLNDNEVENNCVRIPLEIQLRNSIELKKAIAISLPGPKSVVPFFENNIGMEDVLNQNNSFRAKADYMMLKYILELTKEYSVTLPIVSAWSGIAYKENPEYDEKVKKLYFN